MERIERRCTCTARTCRCAYMDEDQTQRGKQGASSEKKQRSQLSQPAILKCNREPTNSNPASPKKPQNSTRPHRSSIANPQKKNTLTSNIQTKLLQPYSKKTQLQPLPINSPPATQSKLSHMHHARYPNQPPPAANPLEEKENATAR